MDKKNDPEVTGEAQTAYLLKREALLRASKENTGSSPSALESMLAKISEEVTTDAAERQGRRET